MSSSFFRQVIVGGGSGFLGQALRSLLTRSGFNVITISRSSQMGLTWSDVEREGLPDAYAVINLSGAGVMDEKLSTERKQALIQSRVATNQILLKAIEARSARGESVPNVFIGTSAVGYYPVDTNMKYDETWRTPSLGFASALCEATEQSMRAEWTHPGLAETRRVVIRVGVVLGHGGGIMKACVTRNNNKQQQAATNLRVCSSFLVNYITVLTNIGDCTGNVATVLLGIRWSAGRWDTDLAVDTHRRCGCDVLARHSNSHCWCAECSSTSGRQLRHICTLCSIGSASTVSVPNAGVCVTYDVARASGYSTGKPKDCSDGGAEQRVCVQIPAAADGGAGRGEVIHDGMRKCRQSVTLTKAPLAARRSCSPARNVVIMGA
eukprot:TRINITY_DN3995_c0_g1_i3.p1 TRINITY_DN3995_c0_g1~~TRINITY_DN3995_c0_g1_i3.p1  ORF type:complete len:379 (+),score=42.26 TRINITY_DN3995_c0_g1_i3:48-1184(+)